MTDSAAGFDAAALRNALHALPQGQRANPELLASYIQFYELDFSDLGPIDHQVFTLACGGERIVTQHFLPEEVNGHAIFLHGYYDHVGLFNHLFRYLLARNIAIVSFDQPGHGLSSGPRAVISDFDEYVAAAKTVFQDARLTYTNQSTWHWIGQSMGGGIVMEVMQQHENIHAHLGELVLFAPLVRPYAWWLNRWVFALAKSFIEARPRTVTNNADNPGFIARQRIDLLGPETLPVAWVAAMVSWYRRFVRYPQSQLAPVVVQGDADQTVDWRFGLKLYQRRYPKHRVLVVKQGRHHIVNDAPALRARIWEYLDQHCQW